MSELTKALIHFHQAVDKIDKNARGNYGNFADLANVLSTVTPPLLANNLVITQTFAEDCLVTTLRHTSGETIESTTMLVMGEGRNKTHEWGKAVTYQRRYAVCSILGLVADMDNDAEATPEPATKPKAKPAPVAKTAPSPSPETPLDAEEKSMVLALLGDIHAKDPSKLVELTKVFRAKFNQPESLRLSEGIQTQTHTDFINVYLQG